ncbi:D-alanyl-D-alanine carboxypeptidase [Streptomyces sp. NPDC059063]|uniref:D-alanyl-D-alanine carboxypeptidase n=1 Tax=unclassified Streptomyces TaxID=2593676 RepID=UPI003697C06A
MAGEFPDSSKTVSGGGASDEGAAAADAGSRTPGAGEANGDARLRAAVAAWVAGSDDGDAPAGGEREGSSSGAGGSASGDEGGGAGGSAAASGEGAGASASAGGTGGESAGAGDDEAPSGSAVDMATAVFKAARTETKTGPEADAGDEPGSGAGADAEPVAESKADAQPEPEREADAKSGSGAGAEGDAEAGAEAGAGSVTGAASQAGAEPVVESKSDTETQDKPVAASEAESKADAEADSKAGAEPVAEAGPGADPEAEPKAAPAADAESEPKAGTATKSEPGSEPGSEPTADAKSGSKPAAAPAPEPASDDKPVDPRVDHATAVFRTAKPAPKVDQATAVFKAVQPDAEGKPDSDGKGDGKGDDKAPVDQATAVFKAPRPEPVDQPTTMLKLGEDTPEPKPKPESESERTSKFVALKPLDEPRAKPAPAPAPAPKAEPKPEPKAAPAAGPGAKAATPAQATPPATPERTTQQPLPPKPPLDLLAELTNTPPPPETPTRTIVRRVKIWTPLVILLAIVFAVVQAIRPLPEPKLTLTADDTFSFGGGEPSIPWPSKGQAAMDVDGIGTFGTHGEQKPVPIASIAKVMTTYLILRDHPIKKGGDGKKITVDAQAQRHYEKGKPENESVVKVTKGQKITQYEALQAVMLPSANNVARMLARWDSKGDEAKFVAKMNKTAKELGMKNTHYTDPSGLDKTTVSTAEDLVKLGRVAMENPTFKEIARQPNYKDLNGETQKNFFGLVPTVAIGIKTGTTTAAGGNILFAAEKKIGGKTQVIIGAALAQFGTDGVANIDAVTKVTKDLIAAGQDALKARTVVKKGTVVGEVDDGMGGTTPVVTTKDVTAVGWSGLTAKLELTGGGKKVPHSAKAGTKVGVLSVGDGTNRAIKVPVALQKELTEPGFGAKLTRVG